MRGSGPARDMPSPQSLFVAFQTQPEKPMTYVSEDVSAALVTHELAFEAVRQALVAAAFPRLPPPVTSLSFPPFSDAPGNQRIPFP